jgi:hypothetical protein
MAHWPLPNLRKQIFIAFIECVENVVLLLAVTVHLQRFKYIKATGSMGLPIF